MTQTYKDIDYWHARWEHAWLLRIEGLKFREIAERFDVCNQRAQGMVNQYNWRMRKALRNTKYFIETYDANL